MSVKVPNRGVLTGYLLGLLRARFSELTDDPKPMVGDGIAPEDAGWRGQPGASSFVPYTVLKPQRGQSYRPEGVRVGHAWAMPYALASYGAVRQQADYIADIAYDLVVNVNRVPVSDTSQDPASEFGIMDVLVGDIGGTDHNDQISPPLWARTDTFTVLLSRARDRGSEGR